MAIAHLQALGGQLQRHGATLVSTAATYAAYEPAAPPNYAVRLSGGTYGFGPASADFILGQDFEMRLKHRPLDDSAQYLFAFGDNNTHVAIIRGFVAGKYELFAANGTVLIRATLPVVTTVGSWNDVRFLYQGGRVKGYLNDTLLYDEAGTFTPPGSTTGLLVGTVNPNTGADYGDYDNLALYKAGVQVFEYKFFEGTGPTAADRLNRYAPIVTTGGAGPWSWITL